MKVQTLIDLLKLCDPEAPICLYDDDLDACLDPEYDGVSLEDGYGNYAPLTGCRTKYKYVVIGAPGSEGAERKY